MKKPVPNAAKPATFSMSSKMLGEVASIEFKGSITEASVFESLVFADKTQIHLNFEEISYINSAGVRRWVFWMWNIEKDFPSIKILINRCPIVMWRQIMTVANFVPKITQIKSFYIPYFCEKCQSASMRLFETKPLLDSDDQILKQKLSDEACSACQSTLMMDASLESINRFINNYRPE
jgi:hypothetical protein